MYLTVDCAQFESGKIAFYEFCNSEMTNLIHYSLEKFNLLSKIADITYLVYYSIEKNRAVVYDIAFGAMFVVLGDKITSEVASHIIKQIADEEAENSVVVLQDEKFINDSEKLNTIEQLNASGIQYNDILSI
ncbi:hypothetical protein [Staphylococcus sp. GFQ9D221P]|uniref:hypothetical protein n=1 Tax=Staphylococcus sp. GFQ9D221P TaxID=2804440 RepID=UPI00195006A2|nr:hypothetical protein [Staphylococcus sp. GFQ9D221P]